MIGTIYFLSVPKICDINSSLNYLLWIIVLGLGQWYKDETDYLGQIQKFRIHHGAQVQKFGIHYWASFGTSGYITEPDSKAPKPNESFGIYTTEPDWGLGYTTEPGLEVWKVWIHKWVCLESLGFITESIGSKVSAKYHWARHKSVRWTTKPDFVILNTSLSQTQTQLSQTRLFGKHKSPS
jgi:hypothetical protein